MKPHQLRTVSNTDPALRLLLPQEELIITRSANEKDRTIGRMLDEISTDRLSKFPLEWYGFHLAQRGSPHLIIDTYIHDNQFVSGGEVKPDKWSATSCLDNLHKKNVAEGRFGTPQELIMVGIVHRHGFESGKPKKSHKDMRTLSDFAVMQSPQLEELSDQLDMFRALDEIHVESGDGFIYILGPTPDHITFRIPQDPNLNGLAHLLGHVSRVEAFQRRYVTIASSVIYNQDGTDAFAEYCLVAKSAVQGRFERTYEVPIRIVEGGTDLSLDGLEAEIRSKVSWARKPAPYKAKRGKMPAEIAPTAEKTGMLTELDRLAIFYHSACIYVRHWASIDAMHTTYMASLLNYAAKNHSLHASVNLAGELFSDPLQRGLLFEEPRVHNSSQDAAIKGLLRGRTESDWQEQLGFMWDFPNGDIAYQTNLIRERIPRFYDGL